MRGPGAVVGALIAVAVWASAAHACSCVPGNVANRLADADTALVGVVEAQSELEDGGSSYTVRVERAIKGELGAQVTLTSRMTSCHVDFELGERIGVLLSAGSREVGTCNALPVEELLAAAELPPPTGTARLMAAVDDDVVDAVGLGLDGRPAVYGTREGRPLAQAACGSVGLATALGSDRGPTTVFIRTLPGLIPTGSPSAVDLARISGLACDARGETFWAVGRRDGRTVVVEVRRRRGAKDLLSVRGRAAVTIAGGRAYLASAGRVQILTLTTGRTRTVRHAGRFTQLSVSAGRLAGRLATGRSGRLELADGRLATGARVLGLVWLSRGTLLDAGNGTVLDARLRVKRRLTGKLGRVVGVHGGTAYLASRATLRRLRPGARRATVFAQLPGPVVGLTPVAPRARLSWHSCEKSANEPLTT